MSKAEKSGAGVAATEGRGSLSGPAFRCEAPELKTILQRIADHISEADRRHLAALGAMQEQLVEIGRDAAMARSRLPEGRSSELDRIEDDMAVLAERMAAAGEEPCDGHGACAEQAGNSQPASADEPASRDDEPWDRDQAEALTRVYESEVTGKANYSVDPSDGRTEEHGSASARQIGAQAGSMHWVEFGRERILLEKRLAEIAAKVEKSLAEIRRECAFAELGKRFERLEERVGKVTAGAAEAERESLDRIEARIAELAGRFDAVQAQAARLDGIEAELRALAERMTDERLAEVFGKSVAPSPAMPAEMVAQLVAERLSGQLPQMGQIQETRAEERKRLEELHELVSGFLGERREGEAQTATVLDTMQQAMIRLLDRMDAIEEAAASSGAVPAHPFREDTAQTSEPSRSSEPSAASESEQWSAAQDRSGRAREPRYDPAIFQMYPEPKPAARGGDSDAEAARHQARGAAGASGLQPTSWQGDRLGYVPPQQDAENVVAAARRAMRFAIQAEAGEAAAPGSADQPPPSLVKERYAGVSRRSWFPSRLFILTVAAILAGATLTIATMVGKQMLDEAGEHMLLLPRDEAADPLQGENPDAEPRNRGEEGGKGGERQQQPDYGNQGVPELKQRSGEPPKKMHAAAEGMPARQGEPGTPPAGVANAVQQVRGLDGSVPGRSAPVPARELVDMPAGVTLEETGSITSAARQAPARQPQHSHLPYRPSGAQAHVEPQQASLAQEEAGAEADAGATGEVHTLRVMPPAAVGPQSLRLAAANGDPSAAFEVGARLAEGRGLAQDLAQAAAWYKRAASRGFAPAQYRLATLLERGLGVSSDVAQARVWYLRAAEQGHAKAMHNVAVLSIGGDEGVPDYATAIGWFTKAAQYGVADSQYNLGVLYQSGLGVARDPKEAYKWFALAARAGDQEAARRRDLLKARIPAVELREIDSAIQSWRAEPVDPLVNEPRTAGTLWQRRDSTGHAR